MHKYIVQIFLTLVCVTATMEGRVEKPVLSCSLTATNSVFRHQLNSGYSVRVVRCELGWEVEVFNGHDKENLLYPAGNWHGAQPCQISAWSHRTLTFPDVRLIPVRDSSDSVRIQLINATVTGGVGKERFTGGRLEVYWEKHQ